MATRGNRGAAARGSRAENPVTDEETTAAASTREGHVVSLRDGQEVEPEDDDFEPAEEPEPEPERTTPRVAEPRPPSLPRDIQRDSKGMVKLERVPDPDNPEKVIAFWDRDDRHPTKNNEIWLTSGNSAKMYPTPAVIRAIRDGRLKKA